MFSNPHLGSQRRADDSVHWRWKSQRCRSEKLKYLFRLSLPQAFPLPHLHLKSSSFCMHSCTTSGKINFVMFCVLAHNIYWQNSPCPGREQKKKSSKSFSIADSSMRQGKAFNYFRHRRKSPNKADKWPCEISTDAILCRNMFQFQS